MKEAMLLYAFLFVIVVALLAQTYPPPYPRENAKQVLANDRVVAWDVLWLKGQPTPMHEHKLDQLSVTLRGGTVRVSKLVGPVTVHQSTVGSLGFTQHGTVHMEEGVSDVPQHKIMLELKPSAAPPLRAVPRAGAVKLLENDRVIVWDFTWKPGQKVALPADSFDSVMVFLDGGVLRSGTEEIQRSAGQVIYSSRRAEPYTQQAVEGSPRAVIVELK